MIAIHFWALKAPPNSVSEYDSSGIYSRVYSLNKKEWICSLFTEWILEKSEIRVNLGVNIKFCVIHSFWSDHRDHSGIPSDP